MSLTANPSTIAHVLSSAAPGDAITLDPGDYGCLAIKGAWQPAITIDATGATGQLWIKQATGVHVTGGNWRGLGTVAPSGNAVRIDNSSDVAVDLAGIADCVNGIVAVCSSNLQLTYNEITAFRVDGIDLASCQKVLVEGNYGHSPVLSPPAHPDAVQGWSMPNKPPLADITVRGNVFGGAMQGVTFYNNTPGTAGLPLVNIVVEDNWIAANSANAIVLNGGVGTCSIQRNTVSPDKSLPAGWGVGVQADGVTKVNATIGNNVVHKAVQPMPPRPVRPAPPVVVVPPVPPVVTPPVVVPPVKQSPYTAADVEALRTAMKAVADAQCNMLAALVA